MITDAPSQRTRGPLAASVIAVLRIDLAPALVKPLLAGLLGLFIADPPAPTPTAGAPAPAPEPAVDPQFDVTGISEYNLPPAPRPGCEDALTAAGAKFKASPLKMHWNRSHEFLCGAKQVVQYQRGPAAIR